MVAVAQLVEPRVVVPVVEGSSPFSHPHGFVGVHYEHLHPPVKWWGYLDFAPNPNEAIDENLTPPDSFEIVETAPLIKQLFCAGHFQRRQSI
jgi:hypothetical protein